MRHYAEIVTAVLSCCFCLRAFSWCAAACQGRSLPGLFCLSHPPVTPCAAMASHMASRPIAPRARFRDGFLAGWRSQEHSAIYNNNYSDNARSALEEAQAGRQ